MELDKEETRIVESVKKYFTEKAPMGVPCSICQHRDWKIAPKIFEISEFHSRSAMGGAPRIPVISLMCVNCSNTLFFNAIKLGVVPADEKEGDLK